MFKKISYFQSKIKWKTLLSIFQTLYVIISFILLLHLYNTFPKCGAPITSAYSLEYHKARQQDSCEGRLNYHESKLSVFWDLTSLSDDLVTSLLSIVETASILGCLNNFCLLKHQSPVIVLVLETDSQRLIWQR